MVLLRWVLIVTTSYLVLFSRPFSEAAPGGLLFIAVYLASNIALTRVLPRIRSEFAFDATVVLFDTAAVCAGLALSGNASSEFFVVYFVVVFLSALTERLELVVGAAVLISAAHLYTASQFVGLDHLIRHGYMLRIPFLFVVALFFGYLVRDARSREREAEEGHARELRMDFLSAVSHDIKNPLGTIQSLAMLMLDGDAGPLSEQQTDLVRRLQANTRHVITLALNLIDAARIEAGRLMLHRQCTNLADVVEDALLLARSASELKGIRLHCALAPDTPPVDVDVVHMERVISNLLGNAIKYTAPGGTVGLSVHSVNGDVVLAVHDDGPGIPSDELPTLFEKFRRQARTSINGSGLGLFIVKAIVDAHGGSVEVRSSVGHGTTMTVHLPAAQDSPDHRATN